MNSSRFASWRRLAQRQHLDLTEISQGFLCFILYSGCSAYNTGIPKHYANNHLKSQRKKVLRPLEISTTTTTTIGNFGHAMF
jgi:hypothetical protein